ncbi:SRPBCC family protein [Nakamurella alba]|uniref:SRPBCC family protein n=1 Tax=Nakamurella alba TaxID=2665158 RepID=UPI002AC36E54|nr:SRPBCC family protein [Nakamurella alba]
MELTVRARGPVDPAEAWDRYLRPQRWSEWAPQIRRVRASADTIAPGVTGTVHGPLPGLSVDFTVDAVDPESMTWSWTVRAPFGIVLRLDHEIHPDDTGCGTSATIDGPAPVVLGYAPVARYSLGRLVTLR